MMEDKRQVRFLIYAPKAREICLSGSFNNWDKLPMKKKGEGLWEAKIKLEPDSYEYRLFIDGNWVDNISGCVEVNNICVQDIPAAKRVRNSWGAQSCLLFV